MQRLNLHPKHATIPSKNINDSGWTKSAGTKGVMTFIFRETDKFWVPFEVLRNLLRKWIDWLTAVRFRISLATFTQKSFSSCCASEGPEGDDWAMSNRLEIRNDLFGLIWHLISTPGYYLMLQTNECNGRASFPPISSPLTKHAWTFINAHHVLSPPWRKYTNPHTWNFFLTFLFLQSQTLLPEFERNFSSIIVYVT